MNRYVPRLCLLALVACNSSGSTAVAPPPPNSAPMVGVDIQLLPADTREPLLAKAVSGLLTEEHLRRRPIDDEVSRQAFAEYLDRLDPAKLYLLESDLARLRYYADRMDDQLKSGDLELARFGAALIAARQIVVARLIADLLAKPFDHTDSEDIETDPEKSAFAVTEAALADRWRKLLELQVLERVARMDEVAKALASGQKADEPDAGVVGARAFKDIPATLEGREQRAREDLARSFAGRFSRLARSESLEPAEAFLNAIAAVYDPHTLYMAPADKENFDIEMTGSLEGIGAVLSEDDHFIVVREVVPGGASWRQGQLKAGDLILAVRQEGKEPVDVTDMRINEVVKMIRGPKGTLVTLTVKKPDDEVELITITRDVIVIEASYARGALIELGAKKAKVGYIYLSRFYGDTRSRRTGKAGRNATDDVRALLERFRARKVPGVVLDLRGNGGGLLEHARDISGLFIETGPVVQTRYGDGELHVLADEDASVSYEGSVVVLVDRFSASASEILAGALQDYRRAVIVGTGPTHGKGTVQVLLGLDRVVSGSDKPLGVFKLTIQQYFRINGESTQSRGVVPDIVLPDPAEHIESGERYLDNAVPWSAAKPVEHQKWPGAAWDVTALGEASKARRAGHAAFEAIDTRAAYLAERAKQTLVPLGREAWLARRKRDRDRLEKLDPELAKGPARFSVTAVPYAKGGPTESDANAVKAAAARLDLWQKALARDPWVEEAAYIVTDVAATAR